MINKVILICSELWRLKRRHYSERRDGSEELLIDKIAALIVEEQARQTGYYKYDKFTEPEGNPNYKLRQVWLKSETVNNIDKLRKANGDINFKYCFNAILEKFFEDNPEIKKIQIPKYTYTSKRYFYETY